HLPCPRAGSLRERGGSGRGSGVPAPRLRSALERQWRRVHHRPARPGVHGRRHPSRHRTRLRPRPAPRRRHPGASIDPGRARAADQRHRRAHRPGVHGRRSAVLAVREDYESEHRDLRTALVSLPATGGTARTFLSAADGFRIARAAVAGDGTVAMLASRPAQGRDSVAPDVALWLLEEAGPHRLTDPETLDVASSGADLEVIGPDFLVRRLTRGRTHLLRVARDGAVTTVLDGDVSVEGADAVAIDSGTLVAAALSTPDTRGALVAVE